MKPPQGAVPDTWTGKSQSAANTTTAVNMGWRISFRQEHAAAERAPRWQQSRPADRALNVQATQAQYRSKRADLFPTVEATGLEQIQSTFRCERSSGGRARVPAVNESVLRSRRGIHFYEIDLFGKVRKSHHEALKIPELRAEPAQYQLSLIGPGW